MASNRKIEPAFHSAEKLGALTGAFFYARFPKTVIEARWRAFACQDDTR